MSLIQKFLNKNRENSIKIHCVGDAMIDEYYKVKITRISPEHPVPVMSCQNDFLRRPGGAANVAYQLKHLNVDVNLLCFYDDVAQRVFTQHSLSCLNQNFDSSKLPIKRRYLDNGIQVAPRHDFEIPMCGLSQDQIEKISQNLEDIINQNRPQVAILSDYNKGFFYSKKFKIIDYYKDVLTIVDPKKGPIDKWKGCTVFKPNCKEAEEISGKKNWKDQAVYFQKELECAAVVITFGGEKVVGIYDNQFFEYYPSKKVDVESVIGAGDCFISFFATSMGHGFNPVESAEIAWNAGAVYVQQRMNRPVVPAELADNKIIFPQDLVKRDFKLVFTNGCFDILHKGHISTLNFAKSKGDKLLVALNTDDSIKKFKDKKRPVVPLEHRLDVVSSLSCVDFVTFFEEETPEKILKIIKPDVIVKGGDYTLEKVCGSDFVPEVYLSPYVPNISTTKILENYFLQSQS